MAEAPSYLTQLPAAGLMEINLLTKCQGALIDNS